MTCSALSHGALSRVVMIDGDFSPEMSRLTGLPKGLTVALLSSLGADDQARSSLQRRALPVTRAARRCRAQEKPRMHSAHHTVRAPFWLRAVLTSLPLSAQRPAGSRRCRAGLRLVPRRGVPVAQRRSCKGRSGHHRRGGAPDAPAHSLGIRLVFLARGCLCDKAQRRVRTRLSRSLIAHVWVCRFAGRQSC